MLVTTLMQVLKRQTTVIFFKVYVHHHSAAAGFFNLHQGQHLWTKKKQTKYTSIFLYLCYWFNIKYHSIALTLNPKRNSASYTLLHSPTELKLLNLKSAYTQPSWSAHPWCTTKWSLTGGGRLREKKIHPRRPNCGRFGQEKRKHFRHQYFISPTTSQRLPVTPHRLSCEKVNLHSTLVTWAYILPK